MKRSPPGATLPALDVAPLKRSMTSSGIVESSVTPKKSPVREWPKGRREMHMPAPVIRWCAKATGDMSSGCRVYLDGQRR